MINYTERLDKAIRVAASAHKQQNRKGAQIPYIIHPFSVMVIAGNATDDEDTHIACLFHDIVEDVPERYSAEQIKANFGDNVLSIVLDVTKDDDIEDWRERGEAYIDHIKNEACGEAVIVCAADKINNLQSMLIDYEEKGDKLWDVFTTKSGADQLWWYESILEVLKKRKAPRILIDHLSRLVGDFQLIV